MQDYSTILRRLERQYFRDQMATLGLQMPEGMILRLLDQVENIRQEDIAHRVVLDKGAVARAVARLENKGLVARNVSANCRREKLVSLTEDGQKLAGQLEQVVRRWRGICMADFTPEEQARYDSFLTRIVDNVREYREGENHG